MHDQAVRLAKTDPNQALSLVQPMLDAADPEIRARGHWAAGRALYELARNDEALAELTKAEQLAPSAELKDRIDVSRSAAMLAAGRRREAGELLNELAQNPDPIIAALGRSQRALISLGAGDLPSATEDLTASIQALELSDADGDAAARAIGNLGYCRMAIGQLDEAEACYRRAVDLGRRFGEDLLVAGCLQNLGCLATRRGHLAEAIKLLDEAEQAYRELRGPARNLSTLWDDLAETHRVAGLTGEAVRYARRALQAVEEGGNVDKIAEARFRLAACALDDQDHATAVAESRRAAELFRLADRPIWLHRAWLLSFEAADEASGRVDEETRAEARQAIDELEAAGWLGDALRVRNQIALSLIDDDPQGALQLLGEPHEIHDESIMTGLEALFAAALRKRAVKQSPAQELDRAYELIVAHQQRLTDPELRAGSARLSARFRRLELAEAFEQNDGPTWLTGEERWRAVSFDTPRATPPSDPALAAMSERLRSAAAELAASDRWNAETATEISRLEQDIRRLSRQAGGDPTFNGSVPASANRLDLANLAATLAGRVFVEWAPYRGQLVAILVDGDHIESCRCGPLQPLIDMADMVRSSLARLLRPGLDGRGQESLWAAINDDCAELRASLFRHMEPVADTAGGMVLSPPPQMLALPWSLIVDKPGLPLTLTPSATAWLGSRTGGLTADIGVAIGPGLEHGADDVRADDNHLDVSSRLLGPAATVSAVKSLLETNQIVHLAAHGSFRPDSPRFSSLTFDDGPLALYELERNTSMAPLVVMAACDSGQVAHLSESELLGFAPTLLHAGAVNTIAPTQAVPDRAMSLLANRFYRNLSGRRPDAALAETQRASIDETVLEQAVAAATICFGGDCGPVTPTDSPGESRKACIK